MAGHRRLAATVVGVPVFVTAGSLSLWRVLLRQGSAAETQVRPFTTPSPPVREYSGDPGHPLLTIAMLGDSSARGVGVRAFDDTLAGWIANQLIADGRRVRVVTAAVDGARSEHLAAQARQVRSARPDLVVISVGINDVRHRTRPRTAARQLAEVVTDLRARGAVVVVGTTPDLGSVPAIHFPLREYVRVAGYLLARAQQNAVAAAGGIPVTLRTTVSRRFAEDRSHFGPDGFHPSAKGYALIGSHLLAAVRAGNAANADHRPPAGRRPA